MTQTCLHNFTGDLPDAQTGRKTGGSLEFIPDDAASVLEFCGGGGALADALNSRQPVKLSTIETADVKTLTPDSFAANSFDCVLLHDLLNRVDAPQRVLRLVRGWIARGGVLIAEMPDPFSPARTKSLGRGNWTFREHGVADRYSRRLLSTGAAESLFARCGFDATTVTEPGSEHVILARPRGKSVAPVSVIVIDRPGADTMGAPLFGLDVCRSRYEIIQLPLAMTDGFGEDDHGADIRQITANIADGFCAALGNAIRSTRSDFIAVVDGNVLPPPDWLDRLILAMEADEQRALVGPCFADQPVDYAGRIESSAVLDQRADRHAAGFGGCIEEADELPVSCILLRRSALADVEWIYEKEDCPQRTIVGLSGRARKRGLKSVTAREVLVFRRTAQPAEAISNRIAGSLDVRALRWSPARSLDLVAILGQLPDCDQALWQIENVLDQGGGGYDLIHAGRFAGQCHDPAEALKRLRHGLSGGGHLLMEFPDAGRLLDSNANAPEMLFCRLYTKREIEKLCYRSGYAINEITLLPNRGWRVDAVPAALFDHGLTSIVFCLPADWPVVFHCIGCIGDCTDEAMEFIVVSEQPDTCVPPEIGRERLKIVPTDSAWFHVALGKAVRVATGRQVLLLDPCVIATTGWLRRMLESLHRDPRIAAVGPCSNGLPGLQQMTAGYQHLADLDGFAWEHGAACRGRVMDTAAISTACLLIRREVLPLLSDTDTGSADPHRCAAGFFDRLLAAGYRMSIACDTYVHWSGDADARPIPAAKPFAQRRLIAQQSVNHLEFDGDILTAKSGADPDIHLSLCMIVRDSARTLPACLEGVRKWVDEMIVVDTGSADQTPEIAKRFGAIVHHFAWNNDFSAARNASLSHARGQWIFWMDADDTIDAENGRLLRQAIVQPMDANILGQVVQVHCPGASSGDVTVVDHVKLFRNLPCLRFDGRIHEQILPAIRRAGGEVGWTGAHVVHSGSQHTPAARRRKFERDVLLLKLELRDRPEHTFVLFNLGMTYADAGEHSAAVEYLLRSLRASDPGESHVRKVYAILVSSLTQLGKDRHALDVCRQGLEFFPTDTELNFRAGLTAHRLGHLQESITHYQRAMLKDADRRFGSVDSGIGSFKALFNLAAVQLDARRPDEAEFTYRRVVEQAPLWSPGWHGLVELFLDQRRFGDAQAVVDQLGTQPEMAGEAEFLHARLRSVRSAVIKAAS